MGKWDARNRGRPSQFGQPTTQRMSYVPIVRSAVVDRAEWTELRKNGLAGPDEDAPWQAHERSSDAGELDLPLPDGFDDDELPTLDDASAEASARPATIQTLTAESTSVRASIPAAARKSTPAHATHAGAASERPRPPRDTLDLVNLDDEHDAEALPVPELDASSEHGAASNAGRAAGKTPGAQVPHGQDGALAALETLCAQQPQDLARRGALLQLCIDLAIIPKVQEHTAWLVHEHVSAGRSDEACEIYMRVRERLAAIRLGEATLIEVLDAAHAAEQSQIVVDATKQLVHHFPASRDAGRALATTAGHQLAGGRADLARQTLEYLLSAYPQDGWAATARRKLAELAER